MSTDTASYATVRSTGQTSGSACAQRAIAMTRENKGFKIGGGEKR